MIPILYDKNEQDFSHNGIGYLVDAVKAVVTEERNGIYELSFQYPITGMWYDKIEKGSIIKSKANDTSAPQLFRVYKASKPLKGIVTYSAEHISYDLNGVPTLGLSVENATPQEAMSKAINNAVLPCPFSAVSDITTRNGTTIPHPCSVRSILGGQTGSVLDVWGGEYEFDNFTVKLHKNRGQDNGVTIEYGKNLTDLKQKENISECYTHILPYATYTRDPAGEYDENAEPETVFIYLAEKVLPILNAENIGHTKAFIVNLSDEFNEGELITEQALRGKTAEYLKNNPSLGTPKVNITVSFVLLWQTEEYKNIACLERVKMCDIVTVRFSKLGVDAKAKVIKTVYDALKERYDSINLGDAKETLTDTILEVDKSIKSVKQSTERIESHIRRTDERITLEVIRSKGAEEELSSRIELTAESITSEVTKKITAETDRATSAEQTLSSRITQTAESITAEIIRATGAEEELSTKVELTAESITSEVTKKITAETDRATAAEQTLSTRITQTAESITSEVTRAKNEEEALSSRITQTAESITAEIIRSTAAEETLSSRITQTANSITSEVTRAQNAESSLSTRITQTFDNITLSVSTSTASNQTTSTITMKNGNTTISSTKVVGTTAAQAATIAADAVNGITLSVSNSKTGASSTLTLKNGTTTITSGTIEFTGIVTFSDLETKGKTTINGDNITTGQISADRIDVDSLYITSVYTTLPNAQKSKQCIIYANGNTSLFIGGDSSSFTSNVTSTFIMGKSYVFIGTEYGTSGIGTNLKNLCFDTSNRVIRQNTNNYTWNLGNSTYPFESLYVKTAQLGNSTAGKVGFFGTTPASRQSVSAASTSSSTTASAVATSLNALITALKTYGLIA